MTPKEQYRWRTAKGKKAFLEGDRGVITHSDNGHHVSAPMEDRTAPQSSASHQLVAQFFDKRLPKINLIAPHKHLCEMAINLCQFLPLLCTV